MGFGMSTCHSKWSPRKTKSDFEKIVDWFWNWSFWIVHFGQCSCFIHKTKSKCKRRSRSFFYPSWRFRMNMLSPLSKKYNNKKIYIYKIGREKKAFDLCVLFVFRVRYSQHFFYLFKYRNMLIRLFIIHIFDDLKWAWDERKKRKILHLIKLLWVCVCSIEVVRRANKNETLFTFTLETEPMWRHFMEPIVKTKKIVQNEEWKKIHESKKKYVDVNVRRCKSHHGQY